MDFNFVLNIGSAVTLLGCIITFTVKFTTLKNQSDSNVENVKDAFKKIREVKKELATKIEKGDATNANDIEILQDDSVTNKVGLKGMSVQLANIETMLAKVVTVIIKN